ncbi:MAG: polysaccharide biosynthesis tyrosine autokinase [Pseudomonadota bacterium]
MTGAQSPDTRDPWAEPQAQASQLDIRRLLELLWRQKWVPILCLCISMVLGQIYLKQVVPLYTSRAEVMVDLRGEQVVNLDSVVGELGRNPVPNQIRVLTSQQVLGRVVSHLRLDKDPEFNRALAEPSAIAAWKTELRELLAGGVLGGLLDRSRSKAPDDETENASATHLALVAALRSRLMVRKVPGSDVIALDFTSQDPSKAALIANTLAELYIVDQLETKFEATRRASAWLSDRLGTLKAKVESSEAAVEAYKATHSIVEVDGNGNINLQQLADLNTELIAARAARAQAEARFVQVEQRLARGGITAAAEVVSSPLILTLRTQLSELARKEAELGSRYGEKHPNIINLRAEIADVRGAASGEVRKIIETLRNDAAVARARQQTLEAGVADLESKSQRLSQSTVQLRQLEREANAERAIYENFLNRFRQTTEQEALETPDARVLSVATPPLRPSEPKRKKVLGLSGAAGLALGLGLVALLETLANTFRATGEITERTGLPVLASLPHSGRARRRRLLDYIREKPNSALAEAVRKLRTALFLSNIDAPPRVVAITSSVPGEGKSTTALLLAHMSQQMKKSAIVVDCDIRRPTLHRTMALENGQGLLSVLDGTAELETAIRKDPESGLDLLPTIEAIPQAADVLSSERFTKLVGTLRERYELVVLDTPPILLVSDAAAIGKLADTTVYAVRWDHTPREAAAQGLDLLAGLGIRLAGCVATMVSRRQEARYAAAQYGYGYYSARDPYYAD